LPAVTKVGLVTATPTRGLRHHRQARSPRLGARARKRKPKYPREFPSRHDEAIVAFTTAVDVMPKGTAHSAMAHSSLCTALFMRVRPLLNNHPVEGKPEWQQSPTMTAHLEDILVICEKVIAAPERYQHHRILSIKSLQTKSNILFKLGRFAEAHHAGRAELAWFRFWRTGPICLVCMAAQSEHCVYTFCNRCHHSLKHWHHRVRMPPATLTGYS
jgi:hypothetical protein